MLKASCRRIFFEDLLRFQVRADELLQPQRDDVRVVPGADVILRHFGAWDDEHAVLALGARGLFLDVRHVVVERLARD